jgi:molybdopterin synthase sulfur carrier subunit
MNVTVQFFSYFRDLTGCNESKVELADESTLDELHEHVAVQFPKLAAMRRSTLIAVGVDYQPRDYVLKDGDQVSFFPPVQGG